MSNAQKDLPLFQVEKEDPNVMFLVEHLRTIKGWATAAEINQYVFARIGRNVGDRELRAWAEAASPDVISGQKGYKHVDCATTDEITHFVHWMESQGKKMIARAEAVRRRAHALIGS
jgi:hypothetical protein